MIQLNDIQGLVARDIEEFQRRYDEWILSPHMPIINELITFLGRSRGKLLRPTLTYLCARLLGEVNDRSHFAALVCELLHNGTLLHDDVVDESPERRGEPSANAAFGNKISVLFGDYLLSNSLLALLECGDTRVFGVMASTSKRMAKGELDQVARSKDLTMDEETYYRMISNKTGALLGAAACLGGLSTGANDVQAEALTRFGEELGLAFQIQDDLLDYLGDERDMGKPRGADLRDRKITLPLLHAFRVSTPGEVQHIKALLVRPTPDAIEEVIQFAVAQGGVHASKRRAEEHSEKALAYLSIFPESEVREHLRKLGVFAAARSR